MFATRHSKTPSAIAVLLASLATSAFATDGKPSDGKPADEISALKAEILAIARENSLDAEAELPETRARLEPLVARLVELAGNEDVYTQLRKVEGAWRELWSDDREPQRPGVTLRRDTVYQVVTASGFFYNIGTSVGATPAGQQISYTAFLRGVYTLVPAKKGFDIQFTDIGFVDGFLPGSANLVDTIYKAENDKAFLKKFPFDLRAPRGPINQKGFLSNVYLDDSVRIATGFNQADGRGDLYVLEKAVTPVVTE